ncbi:DNA alkylation repair protein [Desulfovibrio inopinatus]|uniref:DNA alkylation repair protein n=1 Tax=Desulfovibrio inopinatus TaxID=102109 RepID=UPI000424503B|nr:DNA alkylation repair protein [Desulfovibrio inopinatus]
MGLVEYLNDELTRAANPVDAAAMQRYMKTDQPFFGIKTPQRKAIFKQAQKSFPITSRDEYEQTIRTLWAGSHREHMYLALHVAEETKAFYDAQSWNLYEDLVNTASHWDTLDWLATRIVGMILLDQRTFEPTVEVWAGAPGLWVRRASLLVHLKHQDRTNVPLLERTIRKLAHEKEFFIQKAIGWVLRQYARTDPQYVLKFVAEHATLLAPLSQREALKHLSRYPLTVHR